MFKIGSIKKGLSFFPRAETGDRVAVDLSSNTLKLAQLRLHVNRIEVVNIISQPIVGLSDTDTAKAVRNAFLELGAKNAGVFDIVSSNLVITKNIEVPSVEPQEIRDIINLQSGRHTPYSREEIIVDYIDIGNYKQSYTKILLVIIARHVIKRHFEILTRAGLKLERVLFAPEAMGYAAAKILKIAGDDAPLNLVHIDEAFTDFSVIHKSKLLFIRSIPIGSRNFAEEGPRYYERFADELKRSLESYHNENIEKSPHLVVMTGLIQKTKELDDVLNEALHLPLKFVSYFENISLSDKVFQRISTGKGASFFNVLAPFFALGSLKIDLVPEEVKVRRALEERGRELIKTGIWVLAIFILIFSILMSKIYFAAAYLNALDTKYASLNKEAGELDQDYAAVSAVKGYLNRRGYSLEVLTELYNLASLELQLTDIRFDQQQSKFVIRGSAESMGGVFSFVEKLEKSKYLKDVKTKYTTKRKEGLRDLTDFEIGATPTYKGE